MYHCNVNFYFINCPDKIIKTIKTIPPIDKFSHTFSDSLSVDINTIKKADVIFFCSGNIDDIQAVISAKSTGSHLIILAHKDNFSLSDYFPENITDIWFLPLSESELLFRFMKWQNNYKMSKDYWLTKQYMETTMNCTPNLIWYKDKHGIHHKVNNSFCKTVNKTKQQIEGRKHSYIWDVPEDEENDCMESDNEVMTKRKTIIAEELVKSGDDIKLLTTFKAPLYDLDGSVMGTVGVGIDITKERAYEKEITKKNAMMQAIFSAVDCGILCHSTDGTKILSVNKTALKILGYKSVEELTADGFYMISNSVLEEDKPLLRNAIKKLKKEGDSVSIEYRVKHDNGEILHIMGNIKLLKENGEFFYQRFLLDITEQKIQEREKERRQTELLENALLQANAANKAKSIFLSNMSHDIRTPMNAIMGFTNLAIMNIDNQKQVEDYLKKIITSGNHLLSLINDVLDMSQIESGKLQIEESVCSLSDIINNLKNIIYTHIQDKKLELHIEMIDIEDDNIYCDKLRLNQALLNIISNSIKYTHEGGEITVRISEKPQKMNGFAEYEFYIKDNGIGMSEDFISHIYELFARERNTTNSGIQGTGLGMAITKNIVDMMNGTIEVKSKQDVGTEVTIRFSLRIYNKETKELTENTNKIKVNSNANRILLVEDNELNQEIAEAILSSQGFEVKIAENGKVAVDMLKNSEIGYYSLVLMDIQMPVMNGYEAAKAIRNLDTEHSAIPILAMTANAFEQDKQEALKCGMNGHIAKPIDIEKFISKLNDILNKKSD